MIAVVNAETPATPETESSDNAVANINKPAPQDVTPIPSNVIAALNANIIGVSGPRTNPATPITAKEPARATRPLAISSHDILPILLSATDHQLI